MVLQLTCDKNKREIEHSCFPNMFLRTLLESEKTPEILEAKLTGNEMILTTKCSPGGFNGDAFRSAEWVQYSLESKRNTPPQVTFSLDSKNKYTFEFYAGKSFHGVIDGIFNKEGRYSGDKPRDVGLELPSKIDATIFYEAPTAFWRGLPQTFRENIKQFRFSGKYYTISWPREIHIQNVSPVIRKEELDVRVSDCIEYKKREGELKRLKGIVTEDRNGKVKYVEETKQGNTEKRFIVEPSLMDYSFMQQLEEFARAQPTGIEFTSCPREEKSKVGICGEFKNTDFRDVPRAFDDFIGYEGAKIKGGRISIAYHKGNRENPVYIQFENATLEDAERLFLTGQVSTDSAWITPFLDKCGDKVKFYNYGKRCVA